MNKLFLGNSVSISFNCDRIIVTVSIGVSVGMSQFDGKNSTVLLIRVACVMGM